MTTHFQTLGSNSSFFFHFGITYRHDSDSPGEAMTFTLKDLLDGRKIHHVDPDGLHGWIETRDGLVKKAWSTGEELHISLLPLQTWIDRMLYIGHDFDPMGDEWT